IFCSSQLSSYHSIQFHLSYFSFYNSTPHRHLHSFPTRRSSDLPCGYTLRDSRNILQSRHNQRHRAGGLSIMRPDQPETAAKPHEDRKSTRLNSSHDQISYAVFCLKKKKTNMIQYTINHI